jgi:uroporphyrin-3 C-methyltransferase
VDEPQAPVVPPSPPRRGGGVAWLALLLALLALGASGWMVYQAELAPKDDTAAAALAELDARQSEALAQIRSSNATALETLQRQQKQLAGGMEESLTAMQTALQSQRQRLLEINSADRSDWMLAEAEYLLRLANQRLIMAADVRSAIALLASADAILLELDDVELHPARAALARDLAALRAVGQVDVEGIWLRIQALADQVDTLTLFALPERHKSELAPSQPVDWQRRLRSGFATAWETLSSYIVISRRQTAYSPLLDPQWEGLVRQNLRMLLEQARTALLSGNIKLYQLSLDNARRWVAEFFSYNEAAVAALDTELEDLAGLDIDQQYPNISGSLATLKVAIDLRHAVEGE